MMTRRAKENFTSVVSRQSSVVSKDFATTGRVGADASSAQRAKLGFRLRGCVG
jgi:hypothetical protein